MELVEIAKQLNVSPGTVRSWKNRYKWDKKINGDNNATLQKEKKSKRNVAKEKKRPKKEKSIAEKVIEKSDIERAELTEKQKLFCMYYVKYWNATKAYQKAYDCTYNTARVEGCRNLANPNVKRELDKLKQDIREGIQIEAMAVFQKYIDIAFADITDYVSFGQEEVPVMTAFGPLEIKDDKTDKKKTLTKMVNTVKFKDSSEVDGTIISEVSQGKDGAKIKLADKMKALEKLEKYFDLFPDTWKRKIEEEKLALERQKASNETNKDDDLIDDWIEAVDNDE